MLAALRGRLRATDWTTQLRHDRKHPRPAPRTSRDSRMHEPAHLTRASPGLDHEGGYAALRTHAIVRLPETPGVFCVVSPKLSLRLHDESHRTPRITVPLKITLKPREVILISGALLKNGDHLAQFTVENEVPILRQKDILTERQADTICKKIYFVVQLMYFQPGNQATHHKNFWELVRMLSAAVPSVLPLIDEIGELILADRFYQALKAAKKLIAYEDELIRKAHERSQDLLKDSEGNTVGTRH